MVKASQIKAKIRNINWLYKIFLQGYSLFMRHNFDQVEYFCLFIGYARSGHTIIGALLDAHPEIVISIEADALGLMKKGYSRKLIFNYICRKSKLFVEKLDATWTEYSYSVKDLNQGNYRDIKVIGDKKGGETTNKLIRNFLELKQFESLVHVPLKMIHVVRNPLDNIASILIRQNKKGIICDEKFCRNRIENFFASADINQKIIQSYPESVVTIFHEDFVKDPATIMLQLLFFLDISTDKEYLDKCSAIVRPSPNITRDNFEWPDKLREYTISKMKNYTFFSRYV